MGTAVDILHLGHQFRAVQVSTNGNGEAVYALGSILIDASGNALDQAAMIKAAGKKSFTRPNDTTAYAANDLVANDTTAGSVAALAFTGATLTGNGGTGIIEHYMLAKGGAAAATIRAHFLKTNHAVTNGDNGAFTLTALDLDNYIGYHDVVLDSLTANGGGAMGVSQTPPLDYELSSGDTIYVLHEALVAFTPTAQSSYVGKPKFRRLG